eukprot:PhM_4_TR7261/c0_g1_i1/m.39282
MFSLSRRCLLSSSRQTLHRSTPHTSPRLWLPSSSTAPLLFTHARRHQSTTDDESTGLEGIERPIDLEDIAAGGATGQEAVPTSLPDSERTVIKLEPCDALPTRFEVFSGTKVFKWVTTAKFGRRIVGPMHEWADELKYRTGINVQWEPVHPEKVFLREYKHRDDVDVNVYFFGSERAIESSVQLLQQMVDQQPVYVRCAVFKRQEGTFPLWLTLRRINGDQRPPDIPPISLKTPGKWTLLFETKKEAAVRTLYEETGIRVDESDITHTGMLDSMDVEYFWRVPVHYYVAELPEDAEVLGPRTSTSDYFIDWDPKILRQSPDPIDRAWAMYADPKTGCAWLSANKIDELQMPLKGENYMKTRYTPAPHLADLRAATQME